MNPHDDKLADFIRSHHLPDEFADTVTQFFQPLARELPNDRPDGRPLLLGINGAQGTGKSTLADYLSMETSVHFGWNVAVLSIDDFYYTLAEREKLAAETHPLLQTRGVPGTHDTEMLATTIDKLMSASSVESIPLPRFDKAVDDRKARDDWPVVIGPLNLIVLEGWCVGSHAQREETLIDPVNPLERHRDPDGRWRYFVNDQLASHYAPVFEQIDLLVFLRAPSFDCIRRWRLEQEQKLATTSDASASALMNEAAILQFIQHYERLTQHNLDTMSQYADVEFRLNDAHAVVARRCCKQTPPQ